MKTKRCRCCDGTGKQLDQKDVGSKMRRMRFNARISLRSMSRLMGFSASYLSDLELGKRNWTSERMEQYRSVISQQVY